MKNTSFLKAVFPFLCVSQALAASYSADSATSFANAWSALSEGDTIVLSGTVDASAAGALSVHSFSVNISSANGATLTWSGTANAPLPADVVYQGVKVTSSPGVVMSGKDVTIGEGNTFISNEGVVSADGRIVIGVSNVFDSSVAADNGGVICVRESGSLLVEGGNHFTNNLSVGRGGAVCIADATAAPAAGAYSAVLDASTANIVFANNAENAVISGGAIVDPGFANDIFAGKNAVIKMHTETGKLIKLGSGLASADATAVIEKTGKGNLFVGDAEFYAGALSVQAGSVELESNRSWGDGGSSSAVNVASSASFVLNGGSTLSQKINLNGGTLVARQGAVLNSTLSASSDSIITLQLTPTAVTQSSISTTPWLIFAPGARLSQASADNLTLNLDVTAFEQPTTTKNKLFAIDFSNVGDVATSQAVQSLTITYTDDNGVHQTALVLDDDGLLDLSSVLESIGQNVEKEPCMVTGTNAMLSTMNSLSWLKDSSRSSVPYLSVVCTNSARVWGSAMGGNLNMSGDNGDYDYSGCGYSVGVDFKATEDMSIGLAFGQTFGTGDAKSATGADASASVDQTSIMLGAYARYSCKLSDHQNLIFDLFAGYSTADNEMECSAGMADWSDNAFALSAAVTWECLIGDNLYMAPFVALEYSSVSQDDYSMGGDTYTDGSASLLSMPIGVTLFNRMTECAQKSITPYVSAAFVAHLSKDDPEADVSDMDGGVTKSEGIEFESCSVRVNGGIRVEWDDCWTTDVNIGVQSDSSQSIFRISASAAYAF